MALLTAGYWQTTYWPSSYWADAYWPDASIGNVYSIAGVIAMQFGFDATMGVGNKAVVVDEHVVNEFRFPPIPASAPQEIVEYVNGVKVFLNELRLELENQFSGDYHIPGALYVDGDVTLFGSLLIDGAGLCFAEISATNNSTETAIATQNVWVQSTVFDTDGSSNNATPDHTNDHITITRAGKYMINVAASVLSGSGSAYAGEFEVKKNNGTVDLANVHTDRALAGGGGDQGSINMHGIADLTIGDTIEVWCRNKTNTNNIIFEDITLTVIQIAG